MMMKTLNKKKHDLDVEWSQKKIEEKKSRLFEHKKYSLSLSCVCVCAFFGRYSSFEKKHHRATRVRIQGPTTKVAAATRAVPP